jgi:methionyl-tRNA formyltransferase
MRIIFFGTTEFAAYCLDGLISAGHQVPAVVTQPDGLGGRGGKKVITPAVKKYALKRGIDILQPASLDDTSVVRELNLLEPDLLVVSAYGKLLPSSVRRVAVHGAINPHPSLLPRFRGAAPINWAIIRGDRVTGVTVYFLDDRFDTGDIIIQEKVEIMPEETAGTLEERLKPVAVKLLLRAVKMIESGDCPRKSQDTRKTEISPAPAPEIKTKHRKLHWEWDAGRLVRRIRGLSPKPGSFTFFRGKRLTVLDAVDVPNSSMENELSGDESFLPGTLFKSGKRWFVKAGRDFVLPLEVQPDGKRKMSWSDFANGARFRKLDRLD